jgi:hypothetical protein
VTWDIYYISALPTSLTLKSSGIISNSSDVPPQVFHRGGLNTTRRTTCDIHGGRIGTGTSFSQAFCVFSFLPIIIPPLFHVSLSSACIMCNNPDQAAINTHSVFKFRASSLILHVAGYRVRKLVCCFYREVANKLQKSSQSFIYILSPYRLCDL